MAENEQRWNRKESAKAAAGFLFLLAVGLCGAFLWWHNWQLQRKAPHWPLTRGVIVESYTDSSAGGYAPRYYARIKYDYWVPLESSGQWSGDLRKYSGSVDSPTWPFADPVKIAARHWVGASVTVHYDLEDPGRSVLAAWLTWNHAGNWLWLVMAVFPLGVATYFIIVPFILFVVRSVWR